MLQDEINCFWIGLTDRAKEGTWVWNSGMEATFTPWHSWEPDNYRGNEHCALMAGSCSNHAGHQDRWYDFNCKSNDDTEFGGTSNIGALCELL